MTPSKLQPAVFGGLFIGVLSALPVVNLANCCCLWVIAGGVLAAYLLQQNHPLPITVGDGAVVGLLAGVIGGLLSWLVTLGVQMAFGPWMQGISDSWMRNNRDIPPEVREMIGSHGLLAAGLALGITVFIVQLAFATLGGLLGAIMFKKAAPPPAPPFDPTGSTMPGGWPPPPSSGGVGGPGSMPPPPVPPDSSSSI